MANLNAYGQIVNASNLYINGINMSSSITVPNTQITVTAGICRDSTDTFDLILGNYLGQLSQALPLNVNTTLDLTKTGINGLSSGSTLAASTAYLVYVVADVFLGNPTGVMAVTVGQTLIFPYGYNAVRFVGTFATDSSSHIVSFFTEGSAIERSMIFNVAPTVLTAGNATTLTAINLAAVVPSNVASQVTFLASFTPAVAGHTLTVSRGPVNANQSDLITGQVATVPITGDLTVTAVAPSQVFYLVTASGDAATLTVKQFTYNLT